jgi:uncharacterized tellurite resistance protein B-like protein
MAANDRILPICDLLLGAAHADGRLEDSEQDTVRELLSDLSAGALPKEVEARISGFDPARFDLAKTAAQFVGDPIDDRKRLLYLVAAIHEADDELDLAEDAFMTGLAKALELPESATKGLTLTVEIEELEQHFERVRKGPPPTPGKKQDSSVDVDLD